MQFDEISGTYLPDQLDQERLGLGPEGIPVDGTGIILTGLENYNEYLYRVDISAYPNPSDRQIIQSSRVRGERYIRGIRRLLLDNGVELAESDFESLLHQGGESE